MRNTAISLTLLALLIFFSPSAQALPEVFVSPADTSVVAGDEFELRIEIDTGFAALMGYDIAVAFDTSLVNVVSVDEGSLPPTGPWGSFFFWYGSGTPGSPVHVNGAVLGTTVSGPGVLFTIRFQALEPGTSPITITFSDLRDGTNEMILHDPVDTTVIVDSPIPVLTDTWGGVKSRYR